MEDEKRNENVVTKSADELYEEILDQMPDSIHPGSIFAHYNYPLISFLWFLAEEIGINKYFPKVGKWFHNQVNK